MGSQNIRGVVTRHSLKRNSAEQLDNNKKTTRQSRSQPQARRRVLIEEDAETQNDYEPLLTTETQVLATHPDHILPRELNQSSDDLFTTIPSRVEKQGVRIVSRLPKGARPRLIHIPQSSSSIRSSRPPPMTPSSSPNTTPFTSSQSRDSSIRSTPYREIRRADTSMSRANIETTVSYLPWEGVSRREKTISDEYHTPVLNAARQILVAGIFTGQTLRPCSVWPEAEKHLLAGIITETWTRVGKDLADLGRDWPEGVARTPPPGEARKLYDSISGFRGHAMDRARRAVGSHYNFDEVDDMRTYIADLLEGDAFTCIENPRGRFCSAIIVKTIAQVFFQNDKASLGRTPNTASYFNAYTDVMVVWVCTMIYLAISEFEAGTRTMKKFEGALIERVYERQLRTWREMSSERQDTTLEYLRKKVRKQSGWRHTDGEIIPVFNQYANNIDDLVELGLVKRGCSSRQENEIADNDDNPLTDPTKSTPRPSLIKVVGAGNGDRDIGQDTPFHELEAFTYRIHCPEDDQTKEGISSTLSFPEWREELDADEEVAHFWYKITGEERPSETIMDDEDGYKRFLSRVRAHGMTAEIKFGGPGDFIEKEDM